MHETPEVLILGIGNLLWADEGFGIRVVEALHERYVFDQNVRLLDGGTQGIYLVHHIRRCSVLVVFDAIDYGLVPGTMKVVEGDEVPSFLGAKKMSLHQTGFQEVLAMAEMVGEPPAHQVLIGVQPLMLEDFGGGLTEPVRACVAAAIDAALAYLARFGVHAYPRETPAATEEITTAATAWHAYEQGRPDARSAFRGGDERVVMGGGWRGPVDFEQEMASLLAAPGER